MGLNWSCYIFLGRDLFFWDEFSLGNNEKQLKLGRRALIFCRSPKLALVGFNYYVGFIEVDRKNRIQGWISIKFCIQ